MRIERLWVDVTTQFGNKWAEFFTSLEVSYGLDVNNVNHMWLLHLLFLADLNAEINFFVGGWNEHKISMKDQASRSPTDMFLFDMIANGVRGDHLAPKDMDHFSVDWDAMRQARVVSSNLANNPVTEGTTSWSGVGPPQHLNEVTVHTPPLPASFLDATGLLSYLAPFMASMDSATLTSRWVHGLAYTRSIDHSF